MSMGYLILGIITGLAGFGMLFMAMSSSPILKAREKKLREQALENHQSGDGSQM
jgi:hypothetical protein